MTLCWETAYKWASLSKWIAAWCLNRNSTVAGVIIIVTFCIICVCTLWIWGRMMATLMNQWANEAAIVLAYWNTLRKIEEFCSFFTLYVLLSYYMLGTLTPSKRRETFFLKAQWLTSIMWQMQMKLSYAPGRKCRRKDLSEKETEVTHTLFFKCTLTSLTVQRALSGLRWFEGQISWQGNFVTTTCRAADYPWACIIFVYQKMLIACFYEWEKIKS